MKSIIIFPDKEQLEIIKKQYGNKSRDILIVERNNMIDNTDLFPKEVKIRILCCNEEAIYWIMNHWQENMELLFDKKCFLMTQKWETYKLFEENNIPTVYKTKDLKKIRKFPIVAKPNIGFGSIGVSKIENEEELNDYIRKFETEINKTIIKEYVDHFFPQESNFPIFEECIENGQFFSIPFVLDKNYNIHIYPVIGMRKEITSNSNYSWRTFSYEKNFMNNELYEEIKKVIKEISKKWIHTPSVNMVEMIYDKNKKRLNVLEFSPRLVGGRIAKMIQHALGVNLKKCAIDLFIKQQTDLKKRKEKNIIVDICEINIENNIIKKCNSEFLKGYKLIEEERQKSSIANNTLVYRIYEKN